MSNCKKQICNNFVFTGLDPAEPYFYQVAENNRKFLHKRIQSTDAELVDIIHTNANEAKKGSLTNIIDGFFGFWDPIGTVDFYVNGGGPLQPGCLPFKSASMYTRSKYSRVRNKCTPTL